MKISDFKNEEALDLLVEILDPIGEIFSDKDFTDAITKGDKMKAVKLAINNHKEEILTILACLEGKKREEYQANILEMTKQILDVLNDKELVDFFISQGLMKAEDAS